MAKTKLPLLGVQASGSIGDAIVFGNWKGINYARQHVIPANPRSAAQTAQRDLMRFVVSFWQRQPAAVQAAYYASVRNAGYTAFNLFTKRNLLSLRGQSNLSNAVFSPGQSGATNVASLTATGGTGSVSLSATLAEGVAGVTVTRVHFVLARDGAPSGVYGYNVAHQSDSNSPYSVQFSSLSSGTYIASAFTECVDSSGKTVYSVSVNAAVTVS